MSGLVGAGLGVGRPWGPRCLTHSNKSHEEAHEWATDRGEAQANNDVPIGLAPPTRDSSPMRQRVSIADE